MKYLFFLLCAVSLWAQKTHEYCAPCHGEQVTDFQTHPHSAKGLSCDACHGESVKHRTSTGAASPDRVAAPDEVPALCGTCHPAQKKDYLTSKHAALVMSHAKVKSANCATCHGVHALRTVKQTQQQCQKCHVTLPASCKSDVSCVSCHSPHTMTAKR
jgi:hypothetical protein